MAKILNSQDVLKLYREGKVEKTDAQQALTASQPAAKARDSVEIGATKIVNELAKISTSTNYHLELLSIISALKDVSEALENYKSTATANADAIVVSNDGIVAAINGLVKLLNVKPAPRKLDIIRDNDKLISSILIK